MQEINRIITMSNRMDQQNDQRPQYHNDNNTNNNNQQQQVNLLVNDLRDQMTHKFEHMSKSILDRMNGLGDRIESLEQSIDGLMDTQGIERIDSSSSSFPLTTHGVGVSSGASLQNIYNYTKSEEIEESDTN
mmetsp:Transcript_2759/g.5148  ORF Transcript_2759/g.5148 Transcript_2759/m.5148 type:complete len:132 (-) Transcript_2759:1455-1850(-)